MTLLEKNKLNQRRPAADGRQRLLAWQMLRDFLTTIRADGTLLLGSIFVVVGMVGLWLKKTELFLSTGYLSAARFLGYTSDAEMNWWERLSFLRMDLVLFLVVVPLVFMLLLRGVARRWRAWLAVALGAVLMLFFYLQMQALGTIGRYLTVDLIRDGLSWAIDFPEAVDDYVSIDGLIKLFAALAVIVFLALASSLRTAGRQPWRSVRLAEAATLAVMAVGLISASLAALAPVPSLALHRSVLGSMMEVMLARTGASDLPAEEAAALFADVAVQPAGPFVVLEEGKEAGHDVIIFVMETGPSRSYDPLRDREQLPGISALLGRSFVSRQHHTTYPYTSDAVFSILSGMYPIGRKDLLRESRVLARGGIMPLLQARGYEGNSYAPYPDTFEDDSQMFALMGMSGRFISDPESPAMAAAIAYAKTAVASLPEDSPALRQRAVLEDRLARDYMALQTMIDDIVDYKRTDRRFLSMFLPQIGHAPWFDLFGRDSTVERGRDLMILQDAWIAELVAMLQENGWLDETIIVVTADHGIRTRVEDPALPSGTLSDYTYEVPLVVFAPSTLSAMHEVKAATSHIDIAATINSLLAPEDEPFITQGVPVWDAPALADRRIFMFGKDYFGVDGYVENGRYVVHLALNGFTYESGTLPTSDRDLVTDAAQAEELSRPIAGMYELQTSLLGLLICKPEEGSGSIAQQHVPAC